MKYGELAYKTRHTFQLLNFLYLNTAADFERHLAASLLHTYLIRTLWLFPFFVLGIYYLYVQLIKTYLKVLMI